MSDITKNALAASLKKLLNRKTLNKITVKDITDDCGVNRQTFYYHFHDVYELMEWIFIHELEKYTDEGFTTENWQDVILSLMDSLLLEKNFIINVYNSLSRKQLEQYMETMAKPSIAGIVKKISEDYHVSDEDIDFMVMMLTASLMGIMTEWVAGGMDETYNKWIDKFFVILDGAIEYTMQKLENHEKSLQLLH